MPATETSMAEMLSTTALAPELFEHLPDDEAAAVLAGRLRMALKLGHDLVSSIMLACRVDVAVATAGSSSAHS
jgi:hypothetical protein